MSLFESHTELTLLDLSYGGQLASCQRWVGRAAPAAPPRERTPRDCTGLPDMTARVTALEIAALWTKFSGLRERG